MALAKGVIHLTRKIHFAEFEENELFLPCFRLIFPSEHGNS